MSSSEQLVWINAESFYEEFKESLNHVGLRFGEMSKAKVTVQGDQFILRYRNKQTTIIFNEQEPSDGKTLPSS